MSHLSTRYPHIRGKVKEGRHIGRTLHAPTANIAIHQPIKDGIYTAVVKSGQKWHPAVVFIGPSPAIGRTERLCEAHLLGVKKKLYGTWITVALCSYIRKSKKFPTKGALQRAIQADIKKAQHHFTSQECLPE